MPLVGLYFCPVLNSITIIVDVTTNKYKRNNKSEHPEAYKSSFNGKMVRSRKQPWSSSRTLNTSIVVSTVKKSMITLFFVFTNMTHLCLKCTLSYVYDC